MKKYDLFLKEVLSELKERIGCDEKGGIKEIIGAMRGAMQNQVWVKQPSRWIIYDPLGKLKEYSNPKDNPIFNNIMEGFEAIQEYTNGFIKAPSEDKVEIRYEEHKWVDNGIFFEITDGRAYAGEKVNSNNEIYSSGAGASGRSPPSGETCASVQGGDNEGAIPTVFDGQPMNDLDRIWGLFNYTKRRPGEELILNGSHGHLYEERRLK